jgi:hypothetical protein
MMTAQAGRYSKGASGGIRYDRQGEHFRPSLGRERREIAEQITGQQELALDRLARRRGLRCHAGTSPGMVAGSSRQEW